MAYCDKCGAYIPDGQLKCLACGYDPTAAQREEQQRASAAAYQRQKQTEEQRRMEEQRRREEQQKAEEERRRRVDDDRRWAEKEYARRRAERARSDNANFNVSEFGREFARETGFTKNAGGNKLLSILSYFSFLFILPFIFGGDDKFCRFHAKQGLALFVFSAIADALSSTPFGWIMQIMRIYMIFKGVTGAANGRCEPLPFIGKFMDK